MQNMLQMPQQGMQPQQSMPQQQPAQPTTDQIQETHNHLSYMQKMLDYLIKLPDSKLNLESIFDAASDAVHEYQLSGGKRGTSAQMIASEMSYPNFPTQNTPPKQIRQFLQNYFDKSILAQAGVTKNFGAPQVQQQSDIQMNGEQ